jgi:hypothetical protein
MRYKGEVLKRFPDAKLVTHGTWTMRHRSVHMRVESPTHGVIDVNPLVDQQLAVVAWRSAYEWCLRNPLPLAADLPESDYLRGLKDALRLCDARPTAFACMPAAEIRTLITEEAARLRTASHGETV